MYNPINKCTDMKKLKVLEMHIQEYDIIPKVTIEDISCFKKGMPESDDGNFIVAKDCTFHWFESD